MKSAVARWGNSLAVRLPRRLAEQAGLAEGTPVDVRSGKHGLVVAPARPRYKLSELLARHPEDARHGEIDWGSPRGKEVW